MSEKNRAISLDVKKTLEHLTANVKCMDVAVFLQYFDN